VYPSGQTAGLGDVEHRQSNLLFQVAPDGRLIAYSATRRRASGTADRPSQRHGGRRYLPSNGKQYSRYGRSGGMQSLGVTTPAHPPRSRSLGLLVFGLDGKATPSDTGPPRFPASPDPHR